jgi:hypothetical protein
LSERFAIAAREELWSAGRLLESRLLHGEAIKTGDRIDATDAADEVLLALCDRQLEELRSAVATLTSPVRLVSRAASDETTAAIIATRNGISVVTTPEKLHDDLALIPRHPGTAHADWRELPLVWRHGSAAVLLHEAVGHAAEHDAAPVAWPAWLSVDVPLAMRRESFRDVPLRRMTTLVGGQSGAPFMLPPTYIEVVLVAGGSYEPLDDTVSLTIVVANRVDGGTTEALAPFELRATRKDIARALVGATGEPLRYPGVVCSSEGQELIVGSYAPVMVTVFGE